MPKLLPSLRWILGLPVVIAVASLALGLPHAETLAAKKSPDKPLEKAFPHSQKCKRCHLRVFEEWEASAQSRSIISAPFRVSLERYRATTSDKEGSMCFRCHAPSVLEYPDHAGVFIKEIESGDPKLDGVGCAQCHLISEVDPNQHPPHPTYQLDRTVFGSYKNPEENLAHQSVQLPLYSQSQFCVTCHENLPGFEKILPKLLGAWEESKTQKAGKNCQSCHMPEEFGESANGERNRKIANHSFPGRFGKVRADAVKLEVETEVKGQTSEVKVTIQSLVPHNLPLPHPGWSRVEIDLTILGKNLRKVYTEQRYYERVFGDKDGNPTVFDFEAVKVLKENVLTPEEKRVENFTFPTPKDAPSMDVIVTLTYAPIHGDEEFVKEVEQRAALGKKDRAFKPVQIVRFKENVKLTGQE
ncbi:multiheme c-type cytochrome [Candidatus Nitronereus thalassa]|uniref:Multiheme c-type cytochrome n=1 Tax=Candidatus Nitronereus thalassa TaxID=3020898 RepID=A0ABU3KCJ8_9BACT|nr:multiheme c-type cytochrome [Candidatus Nitronereus thalassa]MDT7044145.1 multiheme c-type cytochrome [Candidatus Nitronereus thalassa]